MNPQPFRYHQNIVTLGAVRRELLAFAGPEPLCGGSSDLTILIDLRQFRISGARQLPFQLTISHS